MEDIKLAVDAGCNGVFLIQMAGLDEILDPLAHMVKAAFPNILLGVNYLSLPADIALERSLLVGYDATWSDNPGVRSDCVTPIALRIAEILRDEPEHMFFGSVAFKYQREDNNPVQAAANARSIGMIPTTSGLGTGVAPSADKLASMYDANAQQRLAVASGITPDNVKQLGLYVTHILVATGISIDGDRLDASKLRKLMDNVATIRATK